jgi:nitroreductase
MDKIFDAIYARRSIRRYEERAVEKEKLVKLLEAGMAATLCLQLCRSGSLSL